MNIKVTNAQFIPAGTVGNVKMTITAFLPLDKAEEAKKLLSPNEMVSITKKPKKRSLTANAYCWVVCDTIAKAIHSTKEDVYRLAVAREGRYEMLEIALSALPHFKAIWESRGIGWIVDTISQDGFNATVFAYYGSSTYTTSEMARLIDYLVGEAEDLKLDVMTPAERSLLLSNWKPEI